MPVWSLEQMGLSAEHARSAVGFLTAYANTPLGELKERAIAAAGVDQDPPSMDADPLFRPAADAASALREAAQWALFVEPAEAVALLERASYLFLQLHEPFGAYLATVSGTASADVAGPVWQTVRQVASPTDKDGGDLHVDHPQQQAYLVLAAAGLQSGSDPIDPALTEVLQGSPHRDGAAPVGALGTPIHRYWAIAQHLVVGHPDSPDVIAEHLAAMAARYAEAMHSAQVSEYLWRTGLAPPRSTSATSTWLASRRWPPGGSDRPSSSSSPSGSGRSARPQSWPGSTWPAARAEPVRRIDSTRVGADQISTRIGAKSS